MYYKLPSQNRCKTKPNLVCGFTLVELMVSVSIFALVMVISLGAIITVMDANKKSQTLRSVMDNLNSTMETMTRTIRFGGTYYCGTVGTLTTPLDCAGGGTSMTLFDSSGTQINYSLSGNQIIKTVGGVAYTLTSSDVVITKLSFRVLGSYPNSGGSTNDAFQPKVIMVIGGYVGTKENTKSTFLLETTVSQRKFDYQ